MAEMKQFHSQVSGAPFLVNEDAIQMVYPHEEGATIYVGRNRYNVRETFEDLGGELPAPTPTEEAADAPAD